MADGGKTIQDLPNQLTESQQTLEERDDPIQSLCAQGEGSSMSPASITHISLIRVY